MFGQTHLMNEELKMRVLVTGGAGFVGSNYVRRILDGTLSGVTAVTVLDKLSYAGSRANLSKVDKESFEFIEGDICDVKLVSELANRHDVIVNFAAESHVDRSIMSPRDFVLTNVLGTHTLLEAANRADIKTFIQISTDEVYGSISEGSWVETDPLLPNSPYAATKASAELISRSYSKTFGLDVRITRCSNNYGPYQFPEKIIPLFVTNLIDGIKVPVYGAGANVRDWLHVDDHCWGIHSVLQKGAAGETYNIGGGIELTNLELTNKIITLMGLNNEMIEFVADRLGHDIRYSVDINKISTELKYKPQVQWEVGILNTVNWYLENESWWRQLKK
jgi:dTDP-glucose 4,6-dehydratase